MLTHVYQLHMCPIMDIFILYYDINQVLKKIIHHKKSFYYFYLSHIHHSSPELCVLYMFILDDVSQTIF